MFFGSSSAPRTISPAVDPLNCRVQVTPSGDVVTSTQSAVVLENLIGQFLYNKAEDGINSKPAGAGDKK